MTDELQGRVAIVAGASRGIGAATALALALARAGASVVLAARDGDRLRQHASFIEQQGGRALAVPTHVTDETSVRQLVEGTLDAFGRLDAACNNAAA